MTRPELATASDSVSTASGGRSGINPVARLIAAIVIAGGLVWSIDPVSAGVALALELCLTLVLGVTPRAFWHRTAPIWVAAPLSALTLLLYGHSSGRVHVHWLFIEISDGSIVLALAVCLRVLAIALPAAVLFIGVDPTDLADGLIQLIHLPERFVIGALAALRLAGLFRADYQALEFARRARGVADRGRLRRFLGLAFALLVLSIRRGTALATTMEARGFGGDTARSWARVSRWGAHEWAAIAVAAGLVMVAIAASVASGQWAFIGQ
jgi:energy-coupling factor transport system permease protein